MRNRYGLNVFPWMVPRLIWMGVVVVKCAPRKEVVDYVYMLPTSPLAYDGYPRFSLWAVVEGDPWSQMHYESLCG